MPSSSLALLRPVMPWACALALGLWAHAAPGASGPGEERRLYAMGTELVVYVARSAGATRGASEAAVREVERIEAATSTWRPDSAFSALNRAGGAPVPLAAEWLELLGAALDWQRRTEGAFDPVLGALMRTWGIRDGGRTPRPDELQAAREASGGRLLVLDRGRGLARLLHPGAALEEGGFVKGYALDRAVAALRARGAEAGWLDFGGQLIAFGRPVRARVADPASREVPRVELQLSGASLSTSGTSEHGRHILDPGRGEPCPAWGSVSVVRADGLSADVLSTALFVMGPGPGLAWAEAHGVAALFQPLGEPPRMSSAFRALGPRWIERGSRP